MGTYGRKVTLKRAVLWERKNPDYLTMEQQRDLLLKGLQDMVYIFGRIDTSGAALDALAKVGVA